MAKRRCAIGVDFGTESGALRGCEQMAHWRILRIDAYVGNCLFPKK